MNEFLNLTNRNLTDFLKISKFREGRMRKKVPTERNDTKPPMRNVNNKTKPKKSVKIEDL